MESMTFARGPMIAITVLRPGRLAVFYEGLTS